MKKGELINLLVIMVLSVSLGVWSFMTYSGGVVEGVPEWVLTGDMAFDEVLEVDELSFLVRNGRDSLVLMPGSKALVTWDDENKLLNVDLDAGSLIMAAQAGDMEISVQTDFVRIDSQESIAFIDYNLEKEQLELYSENHPNLVTFIGDGEDYNALTLPSNHRMKVSATKVTPVLSKLRLTKLSKEFPVFEFDDDDIDEELSKALNDVKSAYTESEVLILNTIANESDFGPARDGFGAKINSVLRGFRAFVTVLPHAEERLNEDKGTNALLYSMSHALYGDATSSSFWLNEWLDAGHGDDEIRGLRASLFFVLPGNELYSVKSSATDILFSGEDVLDNLRRRYGEIESLLERASNIEAEQAYKEYKRIFEAALSSGQLEDPELLDEITREYILVEFLLRTNSIFYNVESTELLGELEATILALAGTQQDLDEEMASFVQSRIRFLTNLFDFVVERKVSVDEATDLAMELLFDAEDYLNSISADVAVSSYFAGKLEGFDLAIGFINSPEFRSYDDFNQGLADFKTKAADLVALNEYILNIREGELEGEEIIALEDAIALVKVDIRSAGVQFSDVVSLDDTANRLFELRGARAAGNSFEANYDRETQLFYDLIVGDVRFSTGIQLDAIRDVVEEAASEEEIVEEEVIDDTELVEDSVETLSDSVAIEFAKQRFEAAGLDPKSFSFRVIDLENNIFTFEGQITNQNIPISGVYDGNTNKVSEVVWILEGKSQTLPSLDLGSMETAILSTYEALTRIQ